MTTINTTHPTARRSRRAVVLLLALVLAATVGPGVAPAYADTTTTFGFDELANGTLVDTEYTGSGVTFVQTGGSFGSTGVPAVLANAAVAISDPNVIESRCSGCEFVPHVIRANLSNTAKVVAAKVATGCTEGGANVTMRAYDVGNSVVDTVTAFLGSNAAMSSYALEDPSGSDIAFVRWFDDSAGCSIRVDDLAITLPDGGGTPNFGLSTNATIVTVAAGAPQTVPINVNRVNGSTGDVLMSVTDLDEGVSGAFTPNPAGGTSSETSLQLTASTSAPIDDFAINQVTVTGTPGSVAVGPGSRTTTFFTRVVPTLTTTAPGSVSASLCGTTSATVYQGKAAGYAQTVTLGATGVPSGVDITFTPPTSGGPTNPSVHQMRISPQPTAAKSTSFIQVRGTGAGATTRGKSVTLSVTPLAFTELPASAAPGDTITLRSTGFCPGTQFRFGNDQASITPGAGAYSENNTKVQLTVPRYATTGPIRVFASGINVGASPSFKIREFRRTTGFAFENNYGNHPMNHAILEKTYGRAETNLSIDLCWPFGCSIVSDWIDPFAWLFMKIANEVLTTGSCFGISTTGQRIAKGRQPITPYAPAGATTPWELTGPDGPAPAIRNTIAGWHSVQLSTQFIQKWVTEFVNNGIQPAEILRSRFAAATPANPLLLSFKEGTKGHAVIAYGWRPLPGGGWEVDINDPNIPFTADEETDIDGSRHVDQLTDSTMTFEADGDWSYPSLGWSGGKAAIAIVPYRDWPTDPNMPTGIRDILSLIVPFGAAPAGTITDDQGRTLAADGTGSLPGAAIPIANRPQDQQVMFAIPGDSALTYTVPNTTARTYGQGIIAPGVVGRIDGIEATPGQSDQIGSDPSTGTIWVDPAGAAGDLEVELARQESGKGGGQRLVDLDLAGVDNARTTLTVPDGSGPMSLINAGGSMTVTGSIGRTGGKAAPGTIRLPRTTLAAGHRLVVKPTWSKLASKPTLVEVRDAQGTVVSSTKIKPKNPRLLKSSSVRLAKSKGTKRFFVLSAKAKRLPAGSHLVQRIQVFKGKKLVKTLIRDRAWRGGTKTWTARLKLKKGSYRIQVTTAAVLLTDQVPVSDVAQKSVTLRLR
jgi:hypothetical protein